MRYRFPFKNPSTSSVTLRATCVIHRPFALLAIPATSTRRVESSMKKRMTNRLSPVGGPYFNREKVDCHNLLPVAIEELFPRCLAAPFRSGLDAAPFQNIGDRVVRQHMS